MNTFPHSTPHDNTEPDNFRVLLDRIPIPSFIVDSRLIIFHTNSAASKTFNIDSSSYGNLSFLSLVSRDFQSDVEDYLRSPPEKFEEYTLSTYLIQETIQIPVELTVTTTKNPPQGLVIYASDLSRHMRTSGTPVDTDQIFRLLVETSNVAGMLVVDDKYRFVYVNKKFASMVGSTVSDMIGHDFRNWVHPDDVGLVAGRYEARQRGTHVPPVYDFRIIRADDHDERILRIHSTVLVGLDRITYTAAMAIDVTEEAKGRQKLEESEHKYLTLVETMTSGLAVDTPDGTIKFVNSTLVRMLGYSSEDELVGQPITKMLAGWTMETVRETLVRRQAGVVEQYEANLLTKTGDQIPVIVSVTPLYDSDGQYSGSLAVFTDVSEIKAADTEIRFLLDLLLHDVGNQLQLVLAGTDLLGFARTPEESLTATSYIKDGVNRCLNIISNVRRAEATKVEPPRPIDIVEVLKEECSLLQRQLDVTPVIKELPESQTIRADSALGHLLRNLLENAVKHNPRPDKKIWIRGRNIDSWFELCISDNGPGLPDWKKKELFNPQRRYGGVGLHLVQKIAKKYSARIRVRDRVEGHPKEGLEVCIRFPHMYLDYT